MKAIEQDHPANIYYHLTQFASIAVSGVDAAQFLQGQLTCNINEITETKSSIAAFCNPKGRVISTLLVIKIQTGFLLLLPASLREKVLKKLQMYVLRSKVQLGDLSVQPMIKGLYLPNQINTFPLPSDNFACNSTENFISIKLPSEKPRYILITYTEQTMALKPESFRLGSVDEWRFQDISAGIPWFEINRSEQFIPQMLNIDGLGGISFNKGCYTGQEIIARTHFLGKAKRQLFLGESQCDWQDNSDLVVEDALTQEKIGDVLAAQPLENTSRLLLVLQTVDAETKNLILNTTQPTPITILPFQ